MEDLIVKCVERRLDLDHAQLWRMFACRMSVVCWIFEALRIANAYQY